MKDERGRRPKETPTIDLGIAGHRVSVHSHLASLWETDEDFAESARFFAAGLLGEDRCVLIGDKNDNERTLAALTELGVNVERAMAEARLVVIRRQSTAEEMIRSVVVAFEAAIAAGAPLVRLFGNVGWGREEGPGDAELLRYEARLTELAARFPSVILCLHQLHALTGLIGRQGVLGMHALVLDGHEIVTNPFFVPPAQLAPRVGAIAAELARHQGIGEARRRSAEILQTIFDNIPVMVSFMDPSGHFLLVNREWERVLGWTLEEARTIDTLSKLHPDPERRRRVEEFIRLADGRWEDFLVTTRHGKTLETSWFRKKLSDGSSIGLGLDVTEHKRDQEALRESEERYRNLFESSPVPKILADPGTFQIVAANRAALELYGYSLEEILDKTLLDIRPPEDVEKFKTFLGKPQPPLWRAGIWRHLKKDGTVILVDVTSREVVIQGRKLWLANVSDVTERQQSEDRLQKSHAELRALSERLRVVREEERARMAREVHDEVGQALTALRMDVGWLERKLAGNERQREGLESKLRSMSELIDTTLDAVQRIATELRPGVLDELGLEAAIEWYLKEFEQRTGIACRFRSGLDGSTLDPGRSTAVFRILQEALTNVARHSVATRAKIELSSNGERLRLEIRDNGRGIPKDRIESSASLGLVGMRERARTLGGDVEIRGAAGRGTTVTLTIPL